MKLHSLKITCQSEDVIAYIFLFYLVRHLNRPPINGLFSLDAGPELEDGFNMGWWRPRDSYVIKLPTWQFEYIIVRWSKRCFRIKSVLRSTHTTCTQMDISTMLYELYIFPPACMLCATHTCTNRHVAVSMSSVSSIGWDWFVDPVIWSL